MGERSAKDVHHMDQACEAVRRGDHKAMRENFFAISDSAARGEVLKESLKKLGKKMGWEH